VQTLDYRLAAGFWGLSDPRLAFLVNAVVGGTPAYRTEMIRYDAPGGIGDFDAWVARAVLSPGSPMFLEARYLLAGLVRREHDAFRANRSYFRVSEPLLTFYHAMMRPFWAQLSRAAATKQVWQRSQHRA
jgi:hypothetical protein